MINAAHEGCDGSANEPLAQAASGEVLVRAVNCTPWPAAYPAVVESLSQSVDIALLVIGQDPALSHMLNGQWVDPCTDMQWYASDVAARIEYLKQHVHSVVIALPAWGGNRSLWFLPPDHEARYTCVRDQLRQTALATGATTIDLADVLCPAGPDGTCPDLRERDGMHVDPEDAPMVFGWILDQLRPHAAAGSALRPS